MTRMNFPNVTFSKRGYSSEMIVYLLLLRMSKLLGELMSKDYLILSIKSLKKFFWKLFINSTRSRMSVLQVRLQRVKPLTAIQLISASIFSLMTISCGSYHLLSSSFGLSARDWRKLGVVMNYFLLRPKIDWSVSWSYTMTSVM